MLISIEIDFKTNTMLREIEGHYIMIKGTMQQECITLINIYSPHTVAQKYVRQILMNIDGKANRNTVRVRHFNTH